MENYKIIHPSLPFVEYDNLIKVKRAEGIRVFDDNNEYIDGISGLWNMILGHNNKEILSSIIEQYQKVDFVNAWTCCSEVVYELASEILNFTDYDFSKVMFTCAGSESVELAIKLARRDSFKKGNINKKYIAVFDTSYHGTHFGSMTASGVDREFFQEYAPMLQGFAYLKVPFQKSIKNEIENLERFFSINGEKLAAFLLEPILGVSGVFKIPDEYLKRLKSLCIEYDVLIIFDEISTGFYRTGHKFAYNDVGFVPDILCLSKGLNNGVLPFGLVLVNETISNNIKNDEQIAHFSTQNTNPICCVTALKTLDILKKGNYESIVNEKGAFLNKISSKFLDDILIIKSIRIHGLMMAIELNIDYDFNRVLSISNMVKDNGLMTYPYSNKYSSGLLLLPSYISTNEDLLLMIKIIKKTLTFIKE